MEELMREEQERLIALIKELKEKLRILPEGTFFQVKNGKYTKWYHYLNGKSILIKKSEKAFAEKLAMATFTRCQMKAAIRECKAIEAYLRKCNKDSLTVFLENHPGLRELLHMDPEAPIDFTEWEALIYKKPDWKYSGTLYRTMKGDLVKSRAEKDIADALFLAGIPYRYECGISFNQGRNYFYPDFTILHPQTGEMFLWEHFGMEELGYYRHKNANKMYEYFENGFIPGKNLICTVANDSKKLSPADIKRTIHFYFGR